jgi:hypothetical protein
MTTRGIQPFPLFDQLVAKNKEYSHTNVDVCEICHTINCLPEAEFKLLKAIIYHHSLIDINNINNSNNRHLNNNPKKTIDIEYGGRMFRDNKGLIYILSNFPQSLKEIIYTFVYETTEIAT